MTASSGASRIPTSELAHHHVKLLHLAAHVGK
jgi:hypothetical protein